jgi:uncharacterized Zn finger protein (UPF0148 family)
MTARRFCGHCHTCGTALVKCLDGEEWCPTCQAYRRYRSHGWNGPDAEGSDCCPTNGPDGGDVEGCDAD